MIASPIRKGVVVHHCTALWLGESDASQTREPALPTNEEWSHHRLGKASWCITTLRESNASQARELDVSNPLPTKGKWLHHQLTKASCASLVRLSDSNLLESASKHGRAGTERTYLTGWSTTPRASRPILLSYRWWLIQSILHYCLSIILHYTADL
jgi:hypothetical protein